MKKFKFSLEKILNINEKFLDVLSSELIILNNQLNNIEEEIYILKQKYADTQIELNLKASIAISQFLFVSYKESLDRISANISNKESEKLLILKNISDKKNEIIEKYKEISTHKELKEKEFSKYTYKFNKLQEHETDEFFTTKIIRDL